MDPQLLVTFGVLAVCHSDEQVSCGLSVVGTSGAPETVAATDDLPIRVDWLQQEFRQGPAVTPAGSQVVVSKDLAADQRWPDFGRMCVAVLGLQSMVSIVVPVPHGLATMNYFASVPGALDRLDVDAAIRLAEAAVPATTLLLEDLLTCQDLVSQGAFSRVAVALGIVMAKYGVGTLDGFNLLRDTARRLHRSLFRVAVDVVREGQLPEAELRAASGHCPVRPAQQSMPVQVGGPEMWHEPLAQQHHAAGATAVRRRQRSSPQGSGAAQWVPGSATTLGAGMATAS